MLSFYMWNTDLNTEFSKFIQTRIAQLVASRLGAGEVPDSNQGKGENFSMKIRN